MKQTLQELLAATEDLSKRVHELSEKLDVSDRLSRRLRWLTYLSVVLMVAIMLGGVAIAKTVKENAENAVTACENANESRAANRQLWNYVIDLSLADERESPQEVKLLEDIREWIAQLYKPRDCDELDKEYPAPPPPPSLPKG